MRISDAAERTVRGAGQSILIIADLIVPTIELAAKLEGVDWDRQARCINVD